jgi:hypothetical protein
MFNSIRMSHYETLVLDTISLNVPNISF